MDSPKVPKTKRDYSFIIGSSLTLFVVLILGFVGGIAVTFFLFTIITSKTDVNDHVLLDYQNKTVTFLKGNCPLFLADLKTESVSSIVGPTCSISDKYHFFCTAKCKGCVLWKLGYYGSVLIELNEEQGEGKTRDEKRALALEAAPETLISQCINSRCEGIHEDTLKCSSWKGGVAPL